MVDVNALNDEELRDELVTRGVDVGPIMITTRFLYENKLKRLLAQENVSGDRNHIADGDFPQNGFIINGGIHHAEPEQFVRIRNTTLESSFPTAPSAFPSALPADDTSGKASVDQQRLEFLNENRPAQQRDLYYSHNQYPSQQQTASAEALEPTIFEDTKGLPPQQQTAHREHSSSSESSEIYGEESSRQLSWQEVQQLNLTSSPLTFKSGICTQTSYISNARSNAYCGGSDHSTPSEVSSMSSKNYVTIGFLVVLAIFLFFMIQNIVAYNRGDATYEEL